MKQSSYLATPSHAIHLAIEPQRLEALIRDGNLKVTDFSCLDDPSKQGVWAMFRSLAAKKLIRS